MTTDGIFLVEDQSMSEKYQKIKFGKVGLRILDGAPSRNMGLQSARAGLYWARLDRVRHAGMRRGNRMTRSILLTVLFVLVARFSWGASGPVEQTLEWMAMGETASEQQMHEAGAKLPELSDSQRHELIIEGLKSKSRAVRYEIAVMLNREPKNERYLDRLVDLAEHDPDADVRSSALVRVSHIDARRALPLNRKLITDPDAGVRYYALSGLMLSPEPDDAGTVERALINEHLWIRIGLTKIQALHNKPLDKNIALEGLAVDKTWFEKNPIVPTGYMWRRSSRKDHAEYFVRLIREDALYILGRTGTPDDIPHLERAIARETALGDKEKFAVRSQLIIWKIQLKHLPEDQQLDYLKIKLRDPQLWVRSWAVKKLCVVKGGLEIIDALEKNPSHPAHNSAQGRRHWCSKHASDL